MQTGLLPNGDEVLNLHCLQDSGQLHDAADVLWNLLLKQVQERNPKSRKGKKSHGLLVTKEDIMRVRMSSRRRFWEMAKDINLTMKNFELSGGMALFWNCLHLLMQGAQAGASPRVQVEDNAIFGAPNTKGFCKVWARL